MASNEENNSINIYNQNRKNNNNELVLKDNKLPELNLNKKKSQIQI